MTNVSVKVKKKSTKVAGRRMPLFLQVICKRKIKRITLDVRVADEEWEDEKEQVLIPPDAGNERITELLGIREKLEQAVSEVQLVVHDLKEKGACTAAGIVDEYRRRKRYACWFVYCRMAIGQMEGKLATPTIRNYSSALSAFEEFRGGEDLPIYELDEGIILSFEAHQQKKALAANTIACYCRSLKALWNRAAKDRLTGGTPSPFRHINTRIEKTGKRALDGKTLGDIALLNLNENRPPGLAFARNMFFFSFFARGMAFVDLAHLTDENIQGKYLVYRRSKTGKLLTIELLPIMQEIITKYRQPGSPYLFPILKTKEASWTEYDHALRLQNKRLEAIGKFAGIPHLSTYVGRHSWASIAKVNGVSEEVISECLGHTSVHTTRIYIASLDNSRLDRANRKVVRGKGIRDIFVPKAEAAGDLYHSVYS